VQRLKEILESGSNEYPDFTRSEKYPPWVYDKIREMLPGKLGAVIGRLAMDAEGGTEGRPAPVLDLSNVEETGYTRMYLVSDQAMQLAKMRPSPLAPIPVADTKFGTAVVNNPGSGEWQGFMAAELAEWLAHRLAAGDNKIRLPRIPPKTFPDWESWVRSFSTEEYARQLEDEGLLPKRSAR